MKTILKVIGLAIAATILLGTVYWAGTVSSMYRRMWAGSAVSDSSTKAAILLMRIGQISDGKVEDLKNHLNVELDGDILLLEALIDWDDPGDNDKTAIKILRRISKQRFTDKYQNDNPAIQAKLSAIYDRAVSCSFTNIIEPQPGGGGYGSPAAGSPSPHR